MTTPDRRVGILPAAGALVFAAALLAYVMTVRGHLHYMWSMNDLKVYRWGGELARDSGGLYEQRYDGFYFTYAPLAGVIFAGLSVLSLGDLRWAITIASLLSMVATVWLAWGALGYRRDTLRLGATLAVAGVALWMEPVQKTLYFGQINIILMFLVLADLRQGDDRRWKGAAIGLATGMKLTPAIFIAYLLVTRRFGRRRLRRHVRGHRGDRVLGAAAGITAVLGRWAVHVLRPRRRRGLGGEPVAARPSGQAVRWGGRRRAVLAGVRGSRRRRRAASGGA